MITESLDFLTRSIEEAEYQTSRWYNEPLSFARSKHHCVRVFQRQCDDSMETTMRAFENVIALMVGDKLSHKSGVRKQWYRRALSYLSLISFKTCFCRIGTSLN